MKWQIQKCKLKMKVGGCKINIFQVRCFFFTFYLHKLERDSAMKLSRNVPTTFDEAKKKSATICSRDRDL